MRGGSLCSGGGGLDLGLSLALDVEWAWHCEPDTAAATVLENHYPGVPNHGDLFACDWSAVERVDLVAAGFPCFVAGTLILTCDGYQPVESLAVGDLVLTHEGRWRPVTACHETPDAPVRRICAPGVNLVCTDEHPFYARRANYDAQGRRLDLDPPTWRDAAELAPEDFLGQTLPPVAATEQRPLAFWRLIGRYLADGWMVDRRGRRNGRVVICCANAELDDLRGLVAEAGYRAALERGASSSKLHITRGDLYDFVRPFGRLAHGKRLPGYVHALSQPESEAILAGYLAGDGYLDERGRCWRSTTVSEQLAYGLALLAQRARGVVASVHPYQRDAETMIEGRRVNQRPEWQVRIPFSNRSCLVEDGYGWKKIKRNERLADRATVYNIAVEEDESYVANGAVVHNCPDYSLAGRRTGIEGEHGQVWFGVAAALRTLRPRYVVLENVPGIRTAAGVRRDAGESAVGVVLAALAALGYRWAYDCLRAADVGAPHGRDRWFCVARLAPESAGVGVDADGRVPRGGAGASGPRGPAASAVAAGAEVDDAADAVADGPGAREGVGGGGGADADTGGVARAEAGELAAGPGAGGESPSRGKAGAEIDRTPGRSGRGGGPSLADAEHAGPPRAGGGTQSEGALVGAGDDDPEEGAAAADADDAGRREHGGAVAAGEELGAAERGRGGRGRGEAPPDADGERRGLLGEPEPRGVEGAPGGEPDGRDPDGRLDDAAPSADAAGGGRGRRPAGEGRDGPRREEAVGAEGDAAAGDGGGDAGGADGASVLGGADGAAATSADAGRERGEPRRGRRAAGGAHARRGTPKRDGDRHARPTEPGPDSPRGLTGACGIGRHGDCGGWYRERGDGDAVVCSCACHEAAADADELGRGEGEPRPEVRDGRADALERGERRDAAPTDAARDVGAEQPQDDGRGAAVVVGESGAGARAGAGDPAEGVRDVGGGAGVAWGVYEAAVRRWEQRLGRPAPAPTDERGRLSPRFVEWMLGFPDGWVSDAEIPRTAQLRILGNSVQVQAAERVGEWLARLSLAGVL